MTWAAGPASPRIFGAAGAVQALALGHDFRVGGTSAPADHVVDHESPNGTLGNPSRGLRVSEPASSNPVASLRKGKYYALLVATDHYDDKRLPELSNPIRDAQAIAAELPGHYGYEKPDLLLDPTMDTLAATLGTYLDRTFGPNDSLLIFFAGHGTFNENLKTGYLAVKDSRFADPLYHSYLSHPELYNLVNRIKCNRILLTIDACFGGTFDPQISAKRGQNDLVGCVANSHGASGTVRW